MLHVGPIMLASSIGVKFYIVGGKKVIHDVPDPSMCVLQAILS